MAGDYGKHRRAEDEWNLVWRGRKDTRLRESVLPGVVGEWGVGTVDLVHVCDDPREVGGGSDFVFEEGILVEGQRIRKRRRLI